MRDAPAATSRGPTPYVPAGSCRVRRPVAHRDLRGAADRRDARALREQHADVRLAAAAHVVPG